MKKTITILTVCLLAITQVNAQTATFEWAKTFGGTDPDVSYSISTDASGNVYTTGYFQGAADFYPGSGTNNHTSVGNSDVFIQKLDANGNFLWAKTFGGTNFDVSYSISVDPSGNVYITGYFQGTVDFDPGSGTDNHTSAGNSDVFIQKLDANGNFLWVKTFGGTNFDVGYSISVDTSGNVYTTGYFQDTVDFDPGSGTDNHTSAGNSDVFIQKLDTDGNFLWAKTFGGTSTDVSYSMSIDASGNVYTTGDFRDTIDFDPGNGTDNHTSVGNNDVFIQKLDTDGNFLWAKTFGGTSFDIGSSISVDASGNVYTIGVFRDTVDFNPGSGTDNHTSAGLDDAFIQKLNTDGNFLWAKTFGGTSSDLSYSITVDASKNVYTTGFFASTVDFDPSSGTDSHTSAGNADTFIQKLDENGDFLWAKTFGGTSIDNSYSISVDASGNIYTTGRFGGTADFDPGSGTANHTSAGNYDVFVHKMSSNTMNVGTVVNDFSSQLMLYPNTNNGNFTIDLGNIYENISVLITNITGKLIYSNTFSQSEKVNISIEEVPTGVYFVRISNGEKKAVIKLIKE